MGVLEGFKLSLVQAAGSTLQPGGFDSHRVSPFSGTAPMQLDADVNDVDAVSLLAHVVPGVLGRTGVPGLLA